MAEAMRRQREQRATLEQKREYLSYIEKGGWLMIFAHGYEHRAGYLERWGGTLNLRPVAI